MCVCCVSRFFSLIFILFVSLSFIYSFSHYPTNNIIMMTKLFIMAERKRNAIKKAFAGFMVFALNLSMGGMLALAAPMTASAVSPNTKVLSITCDSVSISGNVWTMSGTVHGLNYQGQSSQYDVAIFSPSGTLNDDSSKDSPDTFNLSLDTNNEIIGTWTNQIEFTSAPSSISAAFYHQAVPGNETSGDAVCAFTLPDTEAPVIAPHADVTVHTTNPSGATVTYTAPATTDNVDGAGVATCDPASGTTFAVGDTTVTCTATDSSNNVATPTTFVVHVILDATPPSGGGGGGSTTFDYWGCTNPAAVNFNRLANRDDGQCVLPGGGGEVQGATDEPQGEVLGAATTADEEALPAGCTAYLSDYLKLGRNNNVEQVKLLQTFLNEEMSAGLPVTGFFGNMTFNWVKKFQVKHSDMILKPWSEAGFKGNELSVGTGYVFKTTKRAINLLKCNSLVIPMPELVPDNS